MSFRLFTIEDRNLIERYSSEKLGWENSFACIWAWNVRGGHEIAEFDDFVILKNLYGEKILFSAPYAVNNDAFLRGMDEIKRYCKENGVNHSVVNLSKEQAELLNPDEYEISTNRNSYDYVYNTSDLISLSGKKYHSKRNFIKRFKDKYEFEFRDYEDDDYDGVCQLFDTWLEGRDPDSVNIERTALVRTLDCHKKMNTVSAVLSVDGKIIGFSAGEVVGKVGHTLFEKADVSFEGIYPTLNNLFAQAYYKDTKYINRQEDMGLEGLRKAKLSYHPIILVEKYSAKIK